MRRDSILILLLTLGVYGVGAQEQLQQQVEITTDNPLPETTIVMPQQPWQVVGEYRVVVEDGKGAASRKSRRRARVKEYSERMDSLIKSRNFVFWPNSMRQLPSGDMRMIYNGYYYFALLGEHVEVHLPEEVGETHLVEMINFDSMGLDELFLTPLQSGWNMRFDIREAEELFRVDITLSTITGESILTLLTPSSTMRYVGCIKPPR